MTEVRVPVGVSLVLAIHNQPNVAELVKRARAVVLNGTIVELIVINDGSDDAHELCQSLVEYIDVYQWQLHRGWDAAVRAGVARALGDVIVVVDLALPFDLADYPRVLSPIVTGDADVVLATLAGACACEATPKREEFSGLSLRSPGTAMHASAVCHGHETRYTYAAVRVDVLEDMCFDERWTLQAALSKALSERRWRVLRLSSSRVEPN